MTEEVAAQPEVQKTGLWAHVASLSAKDVERMAALHDVTFSKKDIRGTLKDLPKTAWLGFIVLSNPLKWCSKVEADRLGVYRSYRSGGRLSAESSIADVAGLIEEIRSGNPSLVTKAKRDVGLAYVALSAEAVVAAMPSIFSSFTYGRPPSFTSYFLDKAALDEFLTIPLFVCLGVGGLEIVQNIRESRQEKMQRAAVDQSSAMPEVEQGNPGRKGVLGSVILKRIGDWLQSQGITIDRTGVTIDHDRFTWQRILHGSEGPDMGDDEGWEFAPRS